MTQTQNSKFSLEQIEKNIRPFIIRLELSPQTQNATAQILFQAYRKGIKEVRQPNALIAASLYIASILENERRTQREICKVTGVSLGTIQQRYRELVYTLELVSS